MPAVRRSGALLALAFLACPSFPAVAQAEDTAAGEARLAVIVLESLSVKGRAPKTGYSREAFGPRWADTDYNGCDTRNDMLRRDLIHIELKPRTRGRPACSNADRKSAGSSPTIR